MRSMHSSWWWLGLLSLSAACGDGINGPWVQVYDVRVIPPDTMTVDANGIVLHTAWLRVESGGEPVEQARLALRVNTGTVVESTYLTDADGRAHSSWVIKPNEYAGLSALTLAACAGNQDFPDCTPKVIVTLRPPAAGP